MSDDGHQKEKQIFLRVSQDRFDRWEDAYEAEGYNSMAGAIRAAMQSEFILEDEGATVDTEEIESIIEDTESNLDNTLNSIVDRLSYIENKVQNDPDFSKLKADLYDSLPSLSQTEYREIIMDGGSDSWEFYQNTATTLYQQHGRTREKVVAALEELRIENKEVEVHEDDSGTRHYYIER